jgi:hypothetical protein
VDGSVELIERVYVPFAGLPVREGPLTVGQRNVLQWLGKVGTTAIGLNRWTFTLPEGVTVDDFGRVFGPLFARYESLRTTFHLGGAPRQRVIGEGRQAIDVYTGESGPDEEALISRLVDRLRLAPFDLATELPLRIAVFVEDGTVRIALAVFTHMAFDIGSMALVGLHLTGLLTDPSYTIPADEGWQPIDRAEWEMSPSGQRQLRASLTFWERQLSKIPHCMYAVPTGRPPRTVTVDWAPPGSSPGARRSPAFEMRSPAAALAVPHIAVRSGTSPTMVVVAAFVAVLAHRTSHRRCAFVSLVDNRIGRHLHGYVGTLAGPSLVVVDADAAGFDELARRLGLASLAAARHAVVDVGELNEMSKQVQLARGVVSARDVVVNNIHQALGLSGAAELPALSELATATEQTKAYWAEWERVPQLLNFRIFQLDETELWFRLGTASITWVPPADLEMMVRGIEALLIAAAPADVELARLTEVTGVTPVARGPGWRYLNGCWVELSQARRLVAAALAPVTTSVFFETTEEGSERLVAYLAGGEVDSPARAHERCVAALPGPSGLEYYTYATIAPERYVVCATAPDDVDDLDSWRRQPVVSEGAGRHRPALRP